MNACMCIMNAYVHVHVYSYACIYYRLRREILNFSWISCNFQNFNHEVFSFTNIEVILQILWLQTML